MSKVDSGWKVNAASRAEALGQHQVSFGWMMPNGSFLRLLALVHCTSQWFSDA